MVNLWLNPRVFMVELVNYELIMLVVACGYQLIIYICCYYISCCLIKIARNSGAIAAK
jgi:hypothetical protein